jgi:hypothetical protein
MNKIPVLLLTTALVGLASQTHAATMVDLELALTLDGSDSISQANFNQQINGYYNIFRGNFFQKYVAALPNQRLAVAAFQFGGTTTSDAFRSIAPWTLISNVAEATAFAENFASVTQIGGRTPLGCALQWSAGGPGLGNCAANKPSIPGIFDNNFEAAQTVIDLNSDGVNSPQTGLSANINQSADYARCNGNPLLVRDCLTPPRVPINGGISALNSISLGTSVPPSFVAINYGTNITGSTQNAFLYSTINDFEAQLGIKLQNEIGRTPEPDLLPGLLGLGILGVGGRWAARHR